MRYLESRIGTRTLHLTDKGLTLGYGSSCCPFCPFINSHVLYLQYLFVPPPLRRPTDLLALVCLWGS